MKKPIAVLISDVHYNIQTLELADKAMRMAISKANELGVSIIVAGDLHDTKANLRAECVNAIIESFKLAKHKPAALVGNHDRINEKISGHGALHFLQPYTTLVARHSEAKFDKTSVEILAYYHDVEELKRILKTIEAGKILIMHQGLTGSNMGDYIQDKTAISTSDIAGLRVISGHYHSRQSTDLPNGGKWDYIGNPYSLSFGEAHDPPKGFQILYNDGSLEFVPTNLRKHVIVEAKDTWKYSSPINDGDLIWVKSYNKQSRQEIAKILGTDAFKLTYEGETTTKGIKQENLTQSEILDNIIGGLDKSCGNKSKLQVLWRQLCE